MRPYFLFNRIQRGSAAVEFALLPPIFLAVRRVLLLTARCLCGDNQCRAVRSGTLPDTVTVAVAVAVAVSMNMYDQIFGIDTGRYGVPIEARYEMRYVGR